MKLPGPDHPIEIEANANRVVVRFEGRVIADSVNALSLKEANYPPVNYIPRDDVDLAQLRRSTHSTHCPFKGDACYFGFVGDGLANVVWSYEVPFDAVAEIAGYLAFYPNHFEITEEAQA
jgi:uncharacterized protein (DUF427 family)